MCDVVGIIEQGQMLAVGTVDEIQNHHASSEQQRWVRVRVLGGAETLETWLAARDDVYEIKVDGELVTFAHRGDENSEVDLLRELIAASFRIAAFGSHQRSLEDVFLQVTAGLVQ